MKQCFTFVSVTLDLSGSEENIQQLNLPKTERKVYILQKIRFKIIVTVQHNALTYVKYDFKQSHEAIVLL